MPVQASEAFLQRAMALFVASHYKNTPNDLVLMSDAPAHQLYALLAPVDETQVHISFFLSLIAILSHHVGCCLCVHLPFIHAADCDFSRRRKL